jgi:excisionase family DNA binding protein
MQEPMFHTVHEAARILRVDAATIYRSIRAGSFPAIRIRSRARRVPEHCDEGLVDAFR